MLRAGNACSVKTALVQPQFLTVREEQRRQLEFSSLGVSESRLLLSLTERAEVFRKEALETRTMDEKRGKQKRRDRVSKTHSGAKTKVRLAICLLHVYLPYPQ